MKSVIKIIVAGTALIYFSCGSNNDITRLPEKYFVCDSSASIPIQFKLTWQPKENDSISILASGGPCSAVNYRTGWLKDSIIKINQDAKSISAFNYYLSFGLSSEEYVIHYTLSIDSINLIDEDRIINKESDKELTKHMILAYLPLYKFNNFKIFRGIKKICGDFPKEDIEFPPDYADSLVFEKSYDIRDYFTISVESGKSKVSLFDKFLNKDAGNAVKVRVNEFRKYMVNLLEPYESNTDDTVNVIFKNGDFVKVYKMLVTKSCLKKKNHVKELLVGFDNTSPDPGDTISVLLSYIDENGNQNLFNQNDKFEIGIVDGCDCADILSSDGEKKKLFNEIQQPIKIVIDNSIPGNSANLRIRVGYIPNVDEEK